MKPPEHEIQAELDAIKSVLAESSRPLSRQQITELIKFSIAHKTLQRRLQRLVDEGVVKMLGARASAKYTLATRSDVSLAASLAAKNVSLNDGGVSLRDDKAPERESIFSEESLSALQFLKTPAYSRPRTLYNRAFLDDYIPNESAYVPQALREKMYSNGRRFDANLAAGTYAKQICQRLLVDLSYNSSRLEGNTYSQLDTQKLVEEGVSADGKIHEETVMIINHKEAILFLVEGAADIEPNSLIIRQIHSLLSQDLLANPASCGSIRSIEVEIGQSTYKPLNNPHMLKELFELMLIKAKKINDPFEQSFFLLVHLSYLQAFEDVNKRTSRLGCNIPFIRKNLCPLSFTGVSRDNYTAALLAVYEKNDIRPLLELYVWAYLRSCEHYAIVKKSVGEIDAFRIQFRQLRKEVMGLVITHCLHDKQAESFIEAFCANQSIQEKERFTAMCLADLSVLHVGAIAGLRVTEGQFNRWQEKKPTLY